MPDQFDIQVNGYAGVDFNSDSIGVEDIAAACLELQRDGVASILATVITASPERMRGRIARIAGAVAASPVAARVIHGIHVEGPCISQQPGYVGTHPAAQTRDASPDVMQPLIEAGGGLVKLVTLAPERDAGHATTRWLADRQIVVSAGHSDATLDQLRGAIDQGLSMFTHLGNGCPLTLARHDNIVQRVLSLAPSLWTCFIADGIHVPWFALRNYLKTVGVERAILVSDAISAAGKGAGRFTLGDLEVVVDNNLATWSSDGQRLMGSACPLPTALENLVREAGIPRNDARRMAGANPRAALGLAAP
ncbi:N-acetylglucosamine-6-phosphate deacetylase [Pirellulimonas nuda]|uniref:N-acetylglucosamine-6-phosphate deacetylase n=1 Tax=Pirellulimonas nuda TaxID=2528009 RepID=A0A518DDY1_9BACT|nr:N-acetylglucosamine-6-phosphate deacetylase [Pirellulimonas nuda]QDU89688.1 N-acetylglucosamine-6-phosphate deacetylase [Pirellulimonas nuda]